MPASKKNDTNAALNGAATGTSTGSANGKAILLGEHFVVHGTPALAIALPGGARASATPARGKQNKLGRDELWIPGWAFRSTASPAAELSEAFRRLVARMPTERTALSVEAHVALPSGAGLGSSGALGVAVARAMAAATPSFEPEDDWLYDAVMEWERVFHGAPSGFDHATSMRDGALLRCGPADALEFIPLTPHPSLHFVIAQVEAGASTSKMVAGVGEWAAARPSRFGALCDECTDLVQSGASALETGDATSLGVAMQRAQELLREVGVSTTALDQAVHVAEQAGAEGAKLTGSGGGGCIVAVARDGEHAMQLREALEAHATHTLMVGGQL